MKAENWQQIKEVFNRAVELDAPLRTGFLDSLNDENLRGEVEKLLAADIEAKTLPDVFAAGNGSSSTIAPNYAGRQIGNYRIVRELGAGGMGAVFLAERADLKKQVALKIVKYEFSAMTLLSRFQNEREILAALEHPNIAHLLDSGTTSDGLPYFVMEYVEGDDLLTFARRRNLSVVEKLKLFRKVCAAVQYAHSRLVVHRDLKPSNILVTETGEPKLLDFGISKLLSESESNEKGTITSFGILTPNYASPEQFRGETVSTSTDVYSLGVILFELLTGALPYNVANRRIDEVARIICETEPERPSSAVSGSSLLRFSSSSEGGKLTDENNGRRTTDDGQNSKLKIQNSKLLRGDLDNIILKALRKEPNRRYSSVEQFSEDLRRHLEGLPVTARPDTFSYRAEKFVRRNFVSVASAASVFLLLLVGVAGISWQYVRAERERLTAERRFRDVRELANAFVFKYHDEIQNLPGSTRLREMLVKDALVYLDRLAADNEGEADLKIEMAQAYMKIGDVQGQAYDANLGDTKGAIESYAKAVRLLEEVNNEKNDLKIANDLITAYQKFGALLGRGGDARQSAEYTDKSVALSERLLAAEPGNNEQILKTAGAYLYQADSLSPYHEAGRMIEIYRRALNLTEKVYAAEPDNPLALRRFIGLNQRLGFQYFLLAQNAASIGEPSRGAEFYQTSLPFYRQSAAAAERQFAVDAQNAIFRRTLFAVKMNLAQVERELGATDTALKTQREIIEEFIKVAASDAANYEAKSDLALAHEDLALTCAKRGEYAAAFENHRRAVELLDEAVKNDTNNKEFWRSRRDVEMRYANSLAASGDYEKAANMYEQAYQKARSAPMLQAAEWQNLYAGELYEKLGDINLKRGERKNISAAERLKNLQAAEIDYQKAIEAWREPECWKINFAATPQRFEYAAKKLADCQSKISTI